MSTALQARRMSRSRLPQVSPSLRRPPPPRAPSPEPITPPVSPSILGPSEAPLLPAEDEDDEDGEGIWEAAEPVTASAAAHSPSLRRRTVAGTPRPGSGGAHSPTLFVGVRVASAPATAAPSASTRVVRVKERVVAFKRAPCKRASRAARPSEPSARVKDVCKATVARREAELKGEGRQRLAADDNARYRAAAASASGKGPSARAKQEEEQAKINHIVQLKAKSLEAHNQAASWLLWGNTAEQCYDQLAESALRSNAVNSAITQKKEKQGANYQTTRINCKGVGA